MIKQEFLVATHLAWEPTNQLINCLVTWEVFGGGLMGNLLTDSANVELSLWPQTKYRVQVTCKNKVSISFSPSIDWFHFQQFVVFFSFVYPLSMLHMFILYNDLCICSLLFLQSSSWSNEAIILKLNLVFLFVCFDFGISNVELSSFYIHYCDSIVKIEENSKLETLIHIHFFSYNSFYFFSSFFLCCHSLGVGNNS